MNCFLVLGVLLGVVGFGSANPTNTSQCSNDNIVAATAQCLDTHGLLPAFIRFQSTLFTAQDLRESCENKEKYQQVMQCVLNVTAPCDPDAIATYDQALRDNAAYCGDPRVNFECLAEYTRNRSALESCMKSHWNSADVFGRSRQENMCYGRKLLIQCARELLQSCDEYTSTTVADRLKSATSIVCYFYLHFLG